MGLEEIKRLALSAEEIKIITIISEFSLFKTLTLEVKNNF